MSLVLDFLRSKNFTAAEAALRAQLEQEVLSGAAPDAADRGLPGTTMSHLESLLLEPVPAAASGRYTSAGPPDSAPTKHARHSPPVAPPVAQAPVAFYESALNPGDDEWTDDDDLGYRRVASTEEALWSCVAAPHRPPPPPPDGAAAPAASSVGAPAQPAPPAPPTPRDKPARDKPERDSRSSPLEIFPNLNGWR